MKMTVKASKKAVPFMLMVAPSGNTNRATGSAMPCSDAQRRVNGKVAMLESVPKTVMRACANALQHVLLCDLTILATSAALHAFTGIQCGQFTDACYKWTECYHAVQQNGGTLLIMPSLLAKQGLQQCTADMLFD